MDKKDYLEVIDLVVLAFYFVVVIAVGLLTTFYANRRNAKGFFLAGRSMTFIPIAGSIFASNVGAPMFIGLAGSAAAVGFVPTLFEWEATFILIILGWLFVPIYISSGSYTMPEYLQKRFGGKRLRIYYSIFLLFISIVSGISGEIYAGCLFMQELLGWNIYLSTVIILAITAVYTIGGGLTAVIYTDTLQAVVLVVGAAVVAALSLIEVGGYEAMVTQFMQAASRDTYAKHHQHGNASCGFPPSDSFHLFRNLDSSYPWPGLIFGLPIIGIFYWCTQQVIVQRNLSAKSITHSKGACVLASYLKLLPFFIFIIPGMVSRIIYPDKIACSSPEKCSAVCSNAAGCTNIAYPLLVLNILPAGLKGLMLAAMLSALMSSLTSHFNSSSSLFTLDIWIHFRKKASQFEVVLVGRIFGLFMISLSVAWLPILQLVQGGRFWDYIQAINSYFSPPWVAAFILGIFWKRTTEQGVWWGLMAGLLVGAIRMMMEFSYSIPICGSPDADMRPAIFAEVHYLTFALILAVITFVVIVVVSILTAPRKANQIRRVTWWTRASLLPPDLTDDENENDQINIAENNAKPDEIGCFRRFYTLICSEKPSQSDMKIEDFTLPPKEDKKWSQICNINSILVLAITCFLIGFYA